MQQIEQLKEQSVEELKVLYRELSKEIYDLANELRLSRKLDKPHLFREKKRDRARVMTILRQKNETVAR